MRFDFIKCHGSGNDFPLIDARDIRLDVQVWAGVARALADRRGPVGGDGILLLTAGDKAQARSWFERSIQSGGWPAFGFIVSEVELRRLR